MSVINLYRFEGDRILEAMGCWPTGSEIHRIKMDCFSGLDLNKLKQGL